MLDRLSHGELLQIIEVSHRCLAVESYDDLRAIITTIEDITSLERAVLCAVDAREDGALEHYVNHSFGEEWGHLYTAHGFDRVDPVLRHARQARGTIRWRDAYVGGAQDQGGGSRASAFFSEAARDFGLVDGIAYACRSRTSQAQTILSLASREERDSERAIELVSSVGPHLHEAYDRLRQRDRDAAALPPPASVVLSPREKEILAWTQDGKTYWEIGQIIGISQRTVKYHFARIKAKLDVVSVSHAVAKAMRLGLLD
jgi:LuxR family quorum sensing-dependent transcriptional regulator